MTNPPLPFVSVRKALLIGVSYVNCKGHALSRPRDRVEDIAKLLQRKYNYRKEDITILSDDPALPQSEQPTTHKNITTHLANFVEDIENAQYFFVFIGHGHQKPEEESPLGGSRGMDEEDACDEYIVPTDAIDEEGKITMLLLIQDDDIKKYLVDKVGKGSQVVAIWDACYSNTIMDLPHYRCNRVNSTLYSGIHRFGRRALEIGSIVVGDKCVDEIAKIAYGFEVWCRDPKDHLSNRRTCTGYCRQDKATKWKNGRRVICISACKDSQVALMKEDGTGESLTAWLIEILNDNHNPSLKGLMRLLGEKAERSYRKFNEHNEARENRVKDKVKQHPQLSTEHPAYMNEPLFLSMQGVSGASSS
ncbi:hypothetical protein P691DRAFT_801401 [Macrolepiota fuliginosa MF-IS2]|uniref:Peptidase C14 caspase domain-containing protein n=1 Tax=Macrolepiota fuliginosa MF-IS2 TaxID=1400762 RepID=A0A9P6C436_9AGAR|nr:hypothetical protein P691DRAFT_801401 [Macrolepiota fuliginosa MF-IS2]